MFDYNLIISDDLLTMDFLPNYDQDNMLEVYKGDEIIGTVKLDGSDFEASSEEIEKQFRLWRTRPERAVGKLVPIEGRTMEQLMESYEELLAGAYILTQKSKIVAGETPRVSIILDWLRTTDFYTAPASTHYHDSVPGGLLVHTLRVYNEMIELHETPTFSKVNVAEATIAALAHDWCKIGYYERYQRNVKNDATGKWEKVDDFRVNQKGIPLGHGVTSLYIVMKLMRITDEQALAIRHHMGAWSVADPEKGELQRANANCPMVYLIQFADQIACAEY